MRAAPVCLCAMLALAACARPEAVRRVALNALPVATQLAKSAPALEQRTALQRRGLAERNADLERQALLDREGVDLLEGEWKFRNDGDRLRRLTVLRDRDDAILADPVAPLTGPIVAATGQNPVSTKDLNAAITTLDRLKGSRRMTAEDLLSFAQSVGDELDKIKAEAEKKSN